MPELPEVEIVRRTLLPQIAGRRLGTVRVLDPRLRTRVNGRALTRDLPGRRILGIRRRAKYLLLDLEGGYVLLLHLGMTGSLRVVPGRRRLLVHDHVLMSLEGGLQIRFNDARRFGLVDLFEAGRETAHPRLRRLGLEPLAPSFGAAALRVAARGRRKPIKNFLMDSTLVAGIGNIYASEALFLAGIHPRRAAGRLSLATWARLAAAVREVLEDAIGQGGTTFRDFVDAEGRPGYFAVRLRVYDRGGEPCARCGRLIRRIVQAGRSTFFCPGCQR